MTVLRIPVRVARAIITTLVVADLIALAAFAFHTTTSTTRTVVPLSATAPITPPNPVIAPPAGGGAGGGGITEPVSSVGSPAGTMAKKSRHHGAPRHHRSPQPTPPRRPVPPVGTAPIGTCPVKLAKPANQGGLQSLVPLAPAFGPFSAEAFAAASAYQPELELLGPILAQYPKLAPKVAPLMTPLLNLFSTGSNQFFTLIAPVYTPHRTQVLSAETKLAAFFAPYSEKLAATPMAGCVVDLEAALVGDTN